MKKDDTQIQSIKARKKIGLGLIAAASIFIFNPDVTVIDLIPDFIGYIMLNFGLAYLADMNHHIDEAKKRFKLMIFVSIAKSLSVFPLFGLGNSSTIPYSLLLYPCIFGVIEMIILIPAYIDLFEGMIYLSMRLDGTAALVPQYPRRLKKDLSQTYGHSDNDRNVSSKMRGFTLFFVVAKIVLSILPECSVLTSSKYSEYGNRLDLYEFIGLLRAFAIIIMTVISICWIVKYIRYFRFISKDTVFLDNIIGDYRVRVLPREGMFTARRINFAFIVMEIAAVLSIDFYVNQNNIIPDILFAVFAALAIFLLKKYMSKSKFLCAVSSLAVFGGISLWASYENAYFNKEFEGYESIVELPAAYDSYVRMMVSTAAEGIAFMIVFAFIAVILYDIIKNHCGRIAINANSTFIDEQNKIFCEELGHKLLRTGVFAIMSAITAFVYDFSKMYQPGRAFLSQSFMQMHPALSNFLQDTIPNTTWFLDLVIETAFAVSFCAALGDILYAVKQRYYLD